MSDYLVALITVALAWWFSTGVVLLLNRQHGAVQRRTVIALSGLALMVLVTVPVISQDRSSLGALLGFTQGLLLWGWLEVTYLTGVVTGFRSEPCPADASLFQRFRLGLQTSIYHELTVLILVTIVGVLSINSHNQVALAVLASLAIMRWSTKLNLFLGVRNYNEDWFPEHLKYLDSYTRRASMNALFPLSVTAGTVLAAVLLSHGIDNPDPFARTSLLMVSALLSLGVLEHWFLMLPFGESALWRWALPEKASPRPIGNSERSMPGVSRVPLK